MLVQGWCSNSIKLIKGGGKKRGGVALLSRAFVPAFLSYNMPQRDPHGCIFNSHCLACPLHCLMSSGGSGFNLRERHLQIGERQ